MINGLKGLRLIVFDLEANDYSNELISIGAIKVGFKECGEFERLVIPRKKRKISKFITKYTGITNEMIDSDGISMKQMIEEFEKFVGQDYQGVKFVCFGDYDEKILRSTRSINNCDSAFLNYIIKNLIDFQKSFHTYVRGSNNNMLSLTNALKTFNVTPLNGSHNALVDAKNLESLIDICFNNQDKVVEEWVKTLSMNREIPPPIKKVILNLDSNVLLELKNFII